MKLFYIMKYLLRHLSEKKKRCRKKCRKKNTYEVIPTTLDRIVFVTGVFLKHLKHVVNLAEKKAVVGKKKPRKEQKIC